jgi:20S proteasome subunit alpha 5
MFCYICGILYAWGSAHSPSLFFVCVYRLFQVEYAIEAVKLGSTAIGVRTAEGVLLAVEKRVTSVLLEPSSVVKIMEIDSHIGCAVSGLIGDARTLVDHARVEAQHHTFTYDEPIGVEAVTQSVCDLALGFGEGKSKDKKKIQMSRPFGVAMLIAGGCRVKLGRPILWACHNLLVYNALLLI